MAWLVLRFQSVAVSSWLAAASVYLSGLYAMDKMGRASPLACKKFEARPVGWRWHRAGHR